MRVRSVVLLVLASNLVTLAVAVGVLWYAERDDFDAAKWHARLPGDRNDDHRRGMVDDLAESYLEVGMTLSDVAWLLGPPDTSDESPEASRTLVRWDIGAGSDGCDYFFVNFAGPDGGTVVEWGAGE